MKCWRLARPSARSEMYNDCEVMIMNAVLERPRVDYHFTRKLTPEEVEELIENYYYDPKYLDPDYDDEDDSDEVEPVWDRFGNPTESTIRAMYESRHGICEEMTVEEAIAEIHAACSGNK